MTRLTQTIGLIGAALGVAGLVAYSIAPDKLWLVTLTEGLALVCLTFFFVSHFRSLQTFAARRSTRLGLNSVISVLLFAGIVVIINVLAARHSTRWDLSETQHFTLAPQTLRVLRGLERDVKITVFTQAQSAGYSTYRDLLDSYRHYGQKLTVKYVDPERSPSTPEI